MRIKQLSLTLALLCTMVQGTWAQASWAEVYAMTNTTAGDWTQLNAGSTTGQTLGAAGTTRYYYADANLTFTNSNAGGSGLTIVGTVYLYVPEGVTVTCTGANDNGATGAGAGIELTEGNALYLIGNGTVNATGGNAANGGNGAAGTDAGWDSNNYWSGTGGTGGDGGQGGAGAASVVSAYSTAGGGSGVAGQAGATAAGAMGDLYVVQSFVNLSATGGQAGSNGTGGNRGLTASQHPGSNVYMASGGGGGGGGAGGFGGAASNIGTGVAAARAAAGLAAKYYDLQGRRLSQPSRAGVYINNGVVKVNK